MKNINNKFAHSALQYINAIICILFLQSVVVSCVDVESDLVEFQEDNQLDSANDTIYSLMGIIEKMQIIADRTVLLGEVRSDIASVTPQASSDLKSIADFTANASNKYNNARDYYAIIQNCNYFIAKADLSLKKRGDSIFVKEYAAIKAFRAWTYLQLAINYGTVPFVTKPILVEKDASPQYYEPYTIQQICEYFIKDLSPYINTPYPNYGAIGSFSSHNLYIPIRILLGDLCLWSGKYQEAAKYYHDYLNDLNSPHPVGNYKVEWADVQFQHINDNYTSQATGTNEVLTYIPMASSKHEGLMTKLDDIFTSTSDNNYFYQATRSKAYDQLSSRQLYTLIYINADTQLPDTIHPSEDIVYDDESLRGDLRLSRNYQLTFQGTSSTTQNAYRQSMKKIKADRVPLYRITPIYLRYAEAINRCGYPACAFAVLKYGLCDDNAHYLDSLEYHQAGEIVRFNKNNFTRNNTIGIHARGCGRCDADTLYAIRGCASKADSIEYVENLIADELALETAGEGSRFYDLIRISFHKGSATYLADKIARRNGVFDQKIFEHLSNQANWYLPLE